MKIAYIITSLANAGPIVVVNDLVCQMTAHGHEVDVYYLDSKVGLDFTCPTHQLSIMSTVDFDKYDIVHCHGLRPDIYVLLRKPLFCKTPVCTTIHSYMEQDHGFKYGRFWAKITSRIVMSSTVRDDKIILLSKHMLDYYKDKLPVRKLTYAYNTHISNTIAALSAHERKELDSFKGNNVLLCSVSGLHGRKGLRQIINVLPLLPNIRYCIVGDGPGRHDLECQALEAGVNDRVLFVGYKDNGFRYLSMADAFVMPSYSEGFPLAMLEAASMGKAIICSDLPVFEEVFSDDEVARFKNDDVYSLKNAIERAIKDKEVLGRNAKKRFDCDYSAENFYKRHIEIYKEIINIKSISYE